METLSVLVLLLCLFTQNAMGQDTVQCRKESDPEGNKADMTPDKEFYNVGETVSFSCRYSNEKTVCERFGDANLPCLTSTCLSNGTWSITRPMCCSDRSHWYSLLVKEVRISNGIARYFTDMSMSQLEEVNGPMSQTERKCRRVARRHCFFINSLKYAEDHFTEAGRCGRDRSQFEEYILCVRYHYYNKLMTRIYRDCNKYSGMNMDSVCGKFTREEREEYCRNKGC